MSNELWSAIVGWVLGTMGTIGFEQFKESRRARRFRDGVRIELRTLQARMATVAVDQNDREGSTTGEILRWAMSRTERASNESSVESMRSAWSKLLEMTEAQIQDFAREGQARREQLALSVRKYELPFLQANLSELTTISDATLASGILDIDAQLRMFNEMVDEAREYLRMTFDSSITGANWDRANGNMRDRYIRLALRAKWIADAIERLSLVTDDAR